MAQLFQHLRYLPPDTPFAGAGVVSRSEIEVSKQTMASVETRFPFRKGLIYYHALISAQQVDQPQGCVRRGAWRLLVCQTARFFGWFERSSLRVVDEAISAVAKFRCTILLYDHDGDP